MVNGDHPVLANRHPDPGPATVDTGSNRRRSRFSNEGEEQVFDGNRGKICHKILLKHCSEVIVQNVPECIVNAAIVSIYKKTRSLARPTATVVKYLPRMAYTVGKIHIAWVWPVTSHKFVCELRATSKVPCRECVKALGVGVTLANGFPQVVMKCPSGSGKLRDLVRIEDTISTGIMFWVIYVWASLHVGYGVVMIETHDVLKDTQQKIWKKSIFVDSCSCWHCSVMTCLPKPTWMGSVMPLRA